VKEVIRLLIFNKTRFANEFCTSFTVVGLAGMFGLCCIRGHRRWLFTSSWPGRRLEWRLGVPVHCLESNGVIIHMTSRTSATSIRLFWQGC